MGWADVCWSRVTREVSTRGFEAWWRPIKQELCPLLYVERAEPLGRTHGGATGGAGGYGAGNLDAPAAAVSLAEMYHTVLAGAEDISMASAGTK